MNIFYLDRDPRICAEMHLDKHVVKMIIEYAQLMSTAHRVLDGDEYFDKCSRLLNCLDVAPNKIPGGDFYPPTPAMPDECKIAGNSLASYHKYYIERKAHFAKWTKREIPLWYKTA